MLFLCRIASFTVPAQCEWLNEVTFAELGEKEAKEQVVKYNKAGRDAGYGPNFNKKQNDGRRNWGRNNSELLLCYDISVLLSLLCFTGHDNRSNRWGGNRGGPERDRNWGQRSGGGGSWRQEGRNHHGGGGWRGPNNNRMMGGNNYNRNQGGGGGYNRNKNQPHNRSQGGSGKMRKVRIR